MRIGYLIGQFPMPTHTFIWRNVKALESLGLAVDLVSTRLPRTALASHAWAEEGIARTTYLADSAGALCASALSQAVANPRAAVQCGRLYRQVDFSNFKHRLRVGALAVFAARLARMSKRRHWDHIHVPFPADAAFIAMYARALGSAPYSLGHHGSPAMFGASGLNLSLKWRHAQFGVAITERLAADLRERLGEDCPADVVIAPMGVDLERFTRQSAFLPYTGKGTARILSCGRGVPDKGHAELVRAVAVLVARGFDVSLRIAGEFDPGAWFTKHLSQVIQDCGLRERVTLLGAVSEEVVIQELSACHVFVLATHDEGLGVAIMEAMAMEVPVVATHVGGVPQLIANGSDGILVPPREPEPLAEAIAEVLNDPALARSFSERGRPKIQARYSPEHGAQSLVDAIHRAGPA